MINWFDRIKKYYEQGFYTEDHVYKFVDFGKITLSEANRIITNR